MPRKWDESRLQIIFAEDDIVFRELSKLFFVKEGDAEEENSLFFLVEHGKEAIEKLIELQDGDEEYPILMVLDKQMPTMGGEKCAETVKEMKAKRELRRVPFIVCCSAVYGKEVSVDLELVHQVFNITLPKPLDDTKVKMILNKCEEWWAPETDSSPEKDSAPSQQKVVPSNLEEFLRYGRVIACDREPTLAAAYACCMTTLGMDEESVHEVYESNEAVDVLISWKDEVPDRPLIVFVDSKWGDKVKELGGDYLKRWRPFFVNTTVNATEPGEGFDAFSKADVDSIRPALNKYKDLWISRR